MNRGDLVNYLSGGTGNTTPSASIGGAKSNTAKIDSQTIDSPTNVTGVVIEDAINNALGDGTLSYTNSGTTLTWAENADTAGAAVDVSTDGLYVLFTNNGGYIVATITAASLPGSDQSDSDLTVAYNSNNLWDDISTAEAVAGDTEYRCVYMANDHASQTAVDIRVYISSDANGADSISLGLDPAGKNGTAATPADESTAPGGVTFSAPVTYGTGLIMGDLDFGDNYPYWIRRVVPSSTSTPTDPDVPVIGFGGVLPT